MVFREIKLKTDQLSTLYHFYKDILELSVSDLNDLDFTVNTTGTKLIFEETSDSLQAPFYHFAFNIPSNRIYEAYEWLKKRIDPLWIDDYKSYIADFSNWNAKSVYFLDPAGNIVEFIARADLNDIVDEQFSSSLVRSISEIGLVFPGNNFRESIEKLMNDHQLTYFIKQPPLESFCAIGNDEGLFIVVPENRSWYPCKDKPAGIFPLEITFSAQKGFASAEALTRRILKQ